ncbi:hypothetical protein I7I50_01271 [Histoplasma capsulatum G186AR]|uniref:Uncharacterized protein n=1 Tax=Ajellomyces capsulatus TaxID=5037 RepID=A0A8H7YZ54_AJECA|nr:hypothetical protein I7I52_08902 [Histoplasma capsulatum]QSS73195.1 hypothetical protein I7I50_01271 [Histoplasma capsulatum G186AR]
MPVVRSARTFLPLIQFIWSWLIFASSTWLPPFVCSLKHPNKKTSRLVRLTFNHHNSQILVGRYHVVTQVSPSSYVP